MISTTALRLTLAPLCIAAFSSLQAQGTRADYERAAQLLQTFAHGKVFRTRVEPHWQPDGARFWYRNDLPDGAREFVVVDALKGTREPAFDPARVAEALAKSANPPADPAQVSIDRIQLADDGGVFVHIRDGWRRYDPNANAVTNAAPPADLPSASLPATSTPHPSNRTGPETMINFVNRSHTDALLYWIDPEGARKPYGTVPAGKEYSQNTYAGHVWLATDPQGKPLAVFEAAENAGDAVISDSPPLAPRRSGPRQRRRSDDASPDGRWQAFIKENNVWLRDAATRAESVLSADGQPGDAYDGELHWSPDSKKLVAVRTKAGGDRRVYLVESSPKDQLQPKLDSYEYLKPGDPIPLSRPHLFDVEARRPIAVSDALFPNPWSISDLRWAPDSSRFTFLYNQRGHQILRILSVDAATGETRPIVEERSPTFIDYSGKLFAHYLDDTGEIIWMSERDGWNHLYLYDAKTGQVNNQITRGEWVVRGVDRVDAEKRQIWFRAGGIRPGQDPYYVHFCRVNFDGSGLIVLTEGDGTHSLTPSPDGRFLIDSYSRVDMAPVTELRNAADGKLVCALERADATGLQHAGWRAPERFAAKARDGATDIYGVIFRPTNFDPQRKYPVLEDIYAGPQDSFVPKAFSPFHGSQEMAELGFIVVQIDGMGTSNRSKKFQDVCWKNIADAGLPDRILWMKAAAAKDPAMDLSRVGIYGTSAGGQSALGALLFHGDFYKAAVADCGCHDNRMDKIWWNEQWMGWPVGPEYDANSNVTHAGNLRGNLLLVVGEMDKNVDPASTMQVVNALIKADKDFDLLVVPGAGHGATGSPYGKRRKEDFFVRHLLGVEPRG